MTGVVAIVEERPSIGLRSGTGLRRPGHHQN